jgi:hypothetical protein
MAQRNQIKVSRYNLVTGEDTYASQTAQNPMTSRRLKSLIPSANGELVRERPLANFISKTLPLAQLPANALGLYQFNYNKADGTVQRFYFANTASKLYIKWNAGAGDYWHDLTNANILDFSGSLVFAVMDNTLYIDSGNGNNYQYEVPDDFSLSPGVLLHTGFPIPQSAPSIDTAVAGAGTFTCLTNRYYWITWADEGLKHFHESSVSPISSGTSAQTNKKIRVQMRPGTVSTTSGSNAVTGVGSNFSGSDIGLTLYVNSILIGVIASVASATSATLVANSPSTQAGQKYHAVSARTTHWHIYASESENSKVGLYLASVPITTMFYDDESPFLGQANSIFLNIPRPLRNDAPPDSTLMVTHKHRLWRNRKTRPNFFNYSADEEVNATANGKGAECVPGASTVTVSDLINDTSFPDESQGIRAFCSHGEALYIGTEKQVLPLYGESIDDFALSHVTAMNVGILGRFSMISTPHGLVFISYDRKLYLYPTANYPWAYVPKDVNVTDQLIEIGKPIRKKLESIKASDIQNVRLTYYAFGSRNWLVLNYQDSDSVYHLWYFDFETKSWFEAQQGFTAVSVFEVTPGQLVLVGAATDRYVYVIDDVSGTFVGSGNYPAATFRPALIDFGDPDHYHIPNYVEFELSNATLAESITVNFYLDPEDVDNPGTPRTITMQPVFGSNKYRGFFTGGVVCQRVLLEFLVAADANAGSIRGLACYAQRLKGVLA